MTPMQETVNRLAQELDVSPEEVERALTNLQERGLICVAERDDVVTPNV